MDPFLRDFFICCGVCEDAAVQSYPIDEKGNLTPMFCMRRHIGGGPDKSRQERLMHIVPVLRPTVGMPSSRDLGMDQLVVVTMLTPLPASLS
ncbi:MAG: hypothetical protein ACLR23_17905 [Clostridia bacterium]